MISCVQLLRIVKLHQAVKSGRLRRKEIAVSDKIFLKTLPKGPITRPMALFVSQFYKSGKKGKLEEVVKEWKKVSEKEKMVIDSCLFYQ